MALSSNQKGVYYFIREMLWLIVTALFVCVVLYPISSKIYYLYWKINALFIFTTFTYFRYSVTFKNLPFLRPSVVRFLIFAANFTLFIYIAQYEQRLISLADNFYLEDFGFPKVFISEAVKTGMFKYLYTEIVFFSTGSLVTLSAFQIRLIISYWQYYRYRANLLLED